MLIFCSCTNNNEEILHPALTKSTDSSGIIYGVVFDSDTEMPIAGATVSIFPSGKKIITGSDGQYEFYDLTENNYVIQVTHTNYVSTVESVKLRGVSRIKKDMRMIRGQNSLVVDEQEINISNLDSHHSLLISNVSNKPIKWNISYDDIFDPATGNVYIYLSEWEGELQPYETKEIFISLTVSAALDNSFAFPLILQSGIEKVGIILVPHSDDGKVYSKIIGKWILYRTGHYEDGIQVRQSLPSDAQILLLKDDLKYELFNNYASIWFGYDDSHKIDLDEVWTISYSSGSYSYNPSDNSLFLGNTFTEGFYHKVLNVTDNELILSSYDFDEINKEGQIYFYTREK